MVQEIGNTQRKYMCLTYSTCICAYSFPKCSVGVPQKLHETIHDVKTSLLKHYIVQLHSLGFGEIPRLTCERQHCAKKYPGCRKVKRKTTG